MGKGRGLRTSPFTLFIYHGRFVSFIRWYNAGLGRNDIVARVHSRNDRITRKRDMIFYGRCPAVCVCASHLLDLGSGSRSLGELDHHFAGFNGKGEGIVFGADKD